LYIKSSKLLPEVRFDLDGNFMIRGRIMSDFLLDFFKPLIEWIDNFQCSRINFDIILDYVNTKGAFCLIDFLRKIENNDHIGEINILWHYEEDDEEHYDRGELICEKLDRSKFHFHALRD
jgi:hypothetical protein